LKEFINNTRPSELRPCILILGGQLTQIPSRSFTGNNNIYGVIIKDQLALIGNDSFDECDNLHTIYYGDNVTYMNGVRNCKLLSYVRMPTALNSRYSFLNCPNLFSLHLRHTPGNDINIQGVTNLHTIINERGAPLETGNSYGLSRLSDNSKKYLIHDNFVYEMMNSSKYPWIIPTHLLLIDRITVYEHLLDIRNTSSVYCDSDVYMIYYIHCIARMRAHIIDKLTKSQTLNIDKLREGHIFTIVDFAINRYSSIQDEKQKMILNDLILTIIKKLPLRIIISFPNICDHLINYLRILRESMQTVLPVSQLSDLVMEYTGATKFIELEKKLQPVLEIQDILLHRPVTLTARQPLLIRSSRDAKTVMDRDTRLPITVDEYNESDKKRKDEEKSDYIGKYKPVFELAEEPVEPEEPEEREEPEEPEEREEPEETEDPVEYDYSDDDYSSSMNRSRRFGYGGSKHMNETSISHHHMTHVGGNIISTYKINKNKYDKLRY